MKYILLIISFTISTTQFAQWTQKGITINGEADSDLSGYGLSMSSDGTTIAIGAVENDGNRPNSGHVKVYTWNGSMWVQKGLNINGENSHDHSGFSIDLNSDGNILAIGADDNDGSATDSGHARIYEWDGVAWFQRGTDIDGQVGNEWLGRAVVLSEDGNTVAIGADNNGVIPAAGAGYVIIFEWNGITWIQKGNIINGEADYDYSGSALAFSSDGNTIIIGAVRNDGVASDAGHIRVYEWDGINWVQKGLDIDGDEAGDYFGRSVSISSDGNTIAIGTINYDGLVDNNTGATKIFSWNGVAWIQKGLTIEGQAFGFGCGRSVSLSSDGNTIALGEEFGGGAASGDVRVFIWDGASWIQKGVTLIGDVANDRFGYVVSLNANGNSFVVSAPYHDVGGDLHAGHVRVYEFFPDPISCFTPNVVTIDCGNSISFDASCSYHADNTQSIVSYEWDFENDGTYDNTGINTSFLFSTSGTYVVKLKVTDNLGVSDSTTVNVIITDNTNPTASNPIPINVECFTDVPLPDITMVTDEADNCTVNPVVAFVSDVSDNNSCAEVITRTYSVTDDDNNSINVTQIITINDVTAPVASNLTPINIECITDLPVYDTLLVIGEADNCTATPIVNFVSDVSDNNSCSEIITRTYNVADSCGNNIDITQAIIINDITVPTASNLIDLFVECIEDAPINSNDVLDENDNCTLLPIVTHVSDVSDGNTCPELIVRTYNVSDDCGNSINVTQNIILNDVTDPVVNIVTLNDIMEVCSVVPNLPTANDNCNGNLIGTSNLPFPITNIGNSTITWTYIDQCGNFIAQLQNVIILEVDISTTTTDPSITANNSNATYKWLNCDDNYSVIPGETAQTFTATVNGNYAVEITENGCVDTSDCVTISTVGINENDVLSEIIISPNPSNGNFTVNFGNIDNVSSINIYSINGQLIYSETITSSHYHTIELNNVSEGLYLIEIEIHQEKMRFKLVIE